MEKFRGLYVPENMEICAKDLRTMDEVELGCKGIRCGECIACTALSRNLGIYNAYHEYKNNVKKIADSLILSSSQKCKIIESIRKEYDVIDIKGLDMSGFSIENEDKYLVLKYFDWYILRIFLDGKIHLYRFVAAKGFQTDLSGRVVIEED